jgi:hypothetical protein
VMVGSILEAAFHPLLIFTSVICFAFFALIPDVMPINIYLTLLSSRAIIS